MVNISALESPWSLYARIVWEQKWFQEKSGTLWTFSRGGDFIKLSKMHRVKYIFANTIPDFNKMNSLARHIYNGITFGTCMRAHKTPCTSN